MLRITVNYKSQPGSKHRLISHKLLNNKNRGEQDTQQEERIPGRAKG